MKSLDFITLKVEIKLIIKSETNGLSVRTNIVIIVDVQIQSGITLSFFCVVMNPEEFCATGNLSILLPPANTPSPSFEFFCKIFGNQNP